MMSAPNPRIQDNAPKLSWFGKNGKGRSPEHQAADDAIERMKAEPFDDRPGAINFVDQLPFTPSREIDLLEELAVILRRLTWSQMTEFGNGISADPKNIHEWSSK
jgi:hypothetical protein